MTDYFYIKHHYEDNIVQFAKFKVVYIEEKTETKKRISMRVDKKNKRKTTTKITTRIRLELDSFDKVFYSADDDDLYYQGMYYQGMTIDIDGKYDKDSFKKDYKNGKLISVSVYDYDDDTKKFESNGTCTDDIENIEIVDINTDDEAKLLVECL